MSLIKKPVRLAHSEGHLDLCYDDEGKHILTCGPDGYVRIFEGFDDDVDDPVSKSVGETVYAVAYKNDRYYAATENNAILVFTFKEGESEGIIMRFTLPVTHMCFNKDGSKLLAGSSDFTVKVIDVETSSHQVLLEHEAPVLSVALHPQETYAASSSCDGTVQICDMQSQKVVKTITGLPKCNDFSRSKTLCRLAWSLDGKHLYIPVEKEVQVLDTVSWKTESTLSDSAIKEVVSVVSVSPCGKYLAASCRDGAILIWDLRTNNCLVREKHPRNLTITSLVWNPKGNKEIAYTDSMGNVGLLENVIPAPTQSDQATAESLADLFDDEDDDMLVQATNPASINDPLADSDDDIPQVTQPKKVTRIEDDDGDSQDTNLGIKGLTNDLDDNKSEAGTDISLPVPRRPLDIVGWQPTPTQSAFQPSACPTHWSHRYMVWNSVGIILHYNTDEENSINIEFHDTATHHAMHVANTLEHTMADLSSEVVVLANTGDEDSQSKLVCMHFSSWDNSGEWSVSMPDGEHIQAVAAGEGWLAAATSERQVRLFSIGGLQKEVVSLPGPVVAMAGHMNQLLVVYHNGMGLPGDQCLGVRLQYVTGKKRTVLSERLPISTKSTLAWLGFSAEGTPFTVDTAGIVRMLHRGFGHSWVQVCNMKQHCKGKSDNYFVVGIHENPAQLRVVMCKGSRYPQTLPRPTVTLLSYKLPLCENLTDKTTFEESYLRSQLFGGHLDWWSTQGYEVDDSAKSQLLMPQQETLMKMFALACKSHREYRAVEICEMMASHHTVQLAIKYATKLRLMQLAQRLGNLARQKLEEETLKAQQQQEAGEDEEEEDFRDALEAGHSHVNTEWSHRNGHAPAATSRRPKQPETQDTEEDGGDVYEEIEQEDMETESEEANKVPMLRMKSREEPKEEPLPESFSQAFAQGKEKKNPFKVSSQKTPTSAKGTSVFDSMEKPKSSSKGGLHTSPMDKLPKKSSNKVADKKKTSTQSKLFAKKKETDSTENEQTKAKEETKRPSKTGFQLWFDSVKADLEEEHPDLSDSDLTITAAKRFRELSDDEKKDWQTKAHTETAGEDTKKRKREINENEDISQNKAAKKDKDSKVDKENDKGVLSENTSSKLAGFAFGKN